MPYRGSLGYWHRAGLEPRIAAPLGVTASDLAAVAGNNQVALTWSAVVGAVGGYRIWRGLATGVESPLAVSGTNSYTDTTAVNGTQYFYKISPLNGNGDGPLSNEVNATPSDVEVVVWTNMVNATDLGSGTISFSGGGGGWGFEHADSTRAIQSGNGYVEWTVHDIANGVICGMDHNAHTSYNDMDFSLYCEVGTGNLYKVEGTTLTLIGACVNGNVLRVEITGATTVVYKKNGSTLNTNSSASITYPVRAGASAYNPPDGGRANVVKIFGTLGPA